MSTATTDLGTAAHGLIDDGFEFCLASHESVLRHLDHAPFGIPVTPLDFLRPSPAERDVPDLMRVYHKLNGLAFGPNGIPMPEWVMIDLGLVSSAFLLITLPRPRVAALLDDDAIGDDAKASIAALVGEVDRLGYTGPVPVAGYCASPTVDPGLWAGWSLCSIVPGRGLGWVAKGVGLACSRAAKLLGVTQYDNRALPIHRAFGPMRVVSATVELHPVPNTFIYETDLTADDASPSPDFHIDARDPAAHRELQSKLDAGGHVLYVLPFARPSDRSQPLLIPILEVPVT